MIVAGTAPSEAELTNRLITVPGIVGGGPRWEPGPGHAHPGLRHRSGSLLPAATRHGAARRAGRGGGRTWGELALSRTLADPTGELTTLRDRFAVFPRPPAEALAEGLWEADLLIGVARRAVSRGDSAYVAGCLSRAIGVCVHALHGAAGRWLVNDSSAAAELHGRPGYFKQRVDGVFAAVSGDRLRLGVAVDLAAALVLETADACAMMLR